MMNTIGSRKVAWESLVASGAPPDVADMVLGIIDMAILKSIKQTLLAVADEISDQHTNGRFTGVAGQVTAARIERDIRSKLDNLTAPAVPDPRMN